MDSLLTDEEIRDEGVGCPYRGEWDNPNCPKFKQSTCSKPKVVKNVNDH